MKFPKDSLTFLGAIVGPDAEWLPRELQQCLDAIEETDRGLATDRRFRILHELIERQGPRLSERLKLYSRNLHSLERPLSVRSGK